MAKIAVTVIPFKQLASLLIRQPHSIKQLCEKTGLQQTTVCRWLSTLHVGPENLVYVDHYKRSATTGPYTQFWAWGYMLPDAIRPLALSKMERKARSIRKLRTVQTNTGVIHASH